MTRHPYAIGHRKDGKTTLAMKCCICGNWLTREDAWKGFLGAKVSHGYHPGCVKDHYGDDLPPEDAV